MEVFNGDEYDFIYRRAMTLEVKCKNAIFLSVNNNILPVLVDGVNIKLNIPISENRERIVLKTRGLFSSVRHEISLKSKLILTETPKLKGALFVKEKKIRKIDSNINKHNNSINLAHAQISEMGHRINSRLVTIKKQEARINDYTNELLVELKTKNNE